MPQRMVFTPGLRVLRNSSPTCAERRAQLVDLRFTEWYHVADEAREARRLLELLEHRHRRRGRIVPDGRSEALEHHRTDRRSRLAVARDRLRDRVGSLRGAG